MPVWGAWYDNQFYFSTGRESRKARNLAVNAHCIVSIDSGNEPVIVEGIACETDAAVLPDRVAESYLAKYEWQLDPNLGPVFAVRPRVVIAFNGNDGEFTRSATRWKFEDL